ncbi:hypothetical protein AAG906_020149 [Vitis piasezkii]
MVVQGCSKLSSNVSTYFTSLNKIWQELDLADDCNWSYATDSGLNKELDEVHGRLLGIKPLPVIEEIFVKVRREETHKRVMLGRVKTPTVLGNTTTDNSALAAHKNDSSHGDTHNNRRNDNLWCDHYQKSNHSCENCWKLNGRPPNFKDN